MNKSQEEYLQKFCASREIDAETALTYQVVKDVMVSLEKEVKDQMHSINIPMSANCS